jgi:hypothetical protein
MWHKQPLLYACLLSTSLKMTEKGQTYRSFTTCGYITVSNYSAVVGIYVVTCHVYSVTLSLQQMGTWASGIQFPHLPFQYVVITPLLNILYVMWILWWCLEVCNNCRWIVLNMYHVIITVTCAYTSTLHVCLQLQHFLGITIFTELQVTENCNGYFKFIILFF